VAAVRHGNDFLRVLPRCDGRHRVAVDPGVRWQCGKERRRTRRIMMRLLIPESRLSEPGADRLDQWLEAWTTGSRWDEDTADQPDHDGQAAPGPMDRYGFLLAALRLMFSDGY
jgi:hypothetical protein